MRVNIKRVFSKAAKLSSFDKTVFYFSFLLLLPILSFELSNKTMGYSKSIGTYNNSKNPILLNRFQTSSITTDTHKFSEFSSNNKYRILNLDNDKHYIKIISSDSLLNKKSAHFSEYVKNLKTSNPVAIINGSFYNSDKGQNIPDDIFIYDFTVRHNLIVCGTNRKRLIRYKANEFPEKLKNEIVHAGGLVILNKTFTIIDIKLLAFNRYIIGNKIDNVQYMAQGYLYMLNKKIVETIDLTPIAKRNVIAKDCNENKMILIQSRIGVATDDIKSEIASRGCNAAISMDGGGSTSFYYNGTIFEQSKRLLPNVIVAYKK